MKRSRRANAATARAMSLVIQPGFDLGRAALVLADATAAPAIEEALTCRIVVGIDDSDSSRQALAWACREAQLRDADLEIVHTWSYPYVGEAAVMSATYYPELDGLEAASQSVLDAAVEAAGQHAGLRVIPKLVRGDAVATLLEVAEGADLLVVGSRGRGGFRGLLLGSVSQHCAHHAPCPVVIVRPPPATS